MVKYNVVIFLIFKISILSAQFDAEAFNDDKVNYIFQWISRDAHLIQYEDITKKIENSYNELFSDHPDFKVDFKGKTYFSRKSFFNSLLSENIEGLSGYIYEFGNHVEGEDYYTVYQKNQQEQKMADKFEVWMSEGKIVRIVLKKTKFKEYIKNEKKWEENVIHRRYFAHVDKIRNLIEKKQFKKLKDIYGYFIFYVKKRCTVENYKKREMEAIKLTGQEYRLDSIILYSDTVAKNTIFFYGNERSKKEKSTITGTGIIKLYISTLPYTTDLNLYVKNGIKDSLLNNKLSNKLKEIYLKHNFINKEFKQSDSSGNKRFSIELSNGVVKKISDLGTFPFDENSVESFSYILQEEGCFYEVSYNVTKQKQYSIQEIRNFHNNVNNETLDYIDENPRRFYITYIHFKNKKTK